MILRFDFDKHLEMVNQNQNYIAKSNLSVALGTTPTIFRHKYVHASQQCS